MPPAVDSLFTRAENIDFLDYSPHYDYRALSEVVGEDACGRTCGTATCAFFNESFSCERLNSLRCSCDGCCFNAPEPMGAGAIFFIFVFSIWGLFSFCNSYYRFYAIREAKELFDGDPPKNDQVHLGDKGFFYVDDAQLTPDQADAIQRRRRYECSLLNCCLPFVAICCPGMHGWYFERANFYFGDWWSSLILFKKQAKEGVVLAKQKTVEVISDAEVKASQAAKYVRALHTAHTSTHLSSPCKQHARPPRAAWQAVHRGPRAAWHVLRMPPRAALAFIGPMRARARSPLLSLSFSLSHTPLSLSLSLRLQVGEGLKEANLNGITLQSATTYDHGKKSTSAHAKSILNKDKSAPSSPSLGIDVAGVSAEDDTNQGADALGAVDGQPVADVPKAVGRIAYALVAVAQGGTAEIRGSPDEIERAAERLERAAYEAREQVAKAQGKAAPAALTHGRAARGGGGAGGGGNTARCSVLSAISAASSMAPTGGGGGQEAVDAVGKAALEQIDQLQTELEQSAAQLARASSERDKLERTVGRANEEAVAAAKRAEAAEARARAAETKAAAAQREAAAAYSDLEVARAAAAAGGGLLGAVAGGVTALVGGGGGGSDATAQPTAASFLTDISREVTALAHEVTQEVEAEPSVSVETAMRPNFRASFVGRPSMAAHPKKRASFLEMAVRQSQMQPRRDSWADEEDEEEVHTPGGSLDERLNAMPAKPKSSSSRLFGRGKKKMAQSGDLLGELEGAAATSADAGGAPPSSSGGGGL